MPEKTQDTLPTPAVASQGSTKGEREEWVVVENADSLDAPVVAGQVTSKKPSGQ